MRLFMCFGASAAVVDDDDMAAVVVTRHRGHHQRERTRSLSFRGKFLPGSRTDKTKKPSPAASPPKHGVDAADAYGLLARASTASASVPCSARLSSAAASLDSAFPSAASTRSTASASTSASSSPSVSGVLAPPPAAKRQASEGPTTTRCPAAGAAAVVLCLLMVVFCGRVGATVLTSTALYLFPRRWPARSMRKEDGVDCSLECDAEEETPQRKVVTEKGSCFLVRNRKN